MGIFAKSVMSASCASSKEGLVSKGSRSRGARSTGSISRGRGNRYQNMVLDSDTVSGMFPLIEQYCNLKSPKEPQRIKPKDLSHSNIDLLTSTVTSNRNSKHRESSGSNTPKSIRATEIGFGSKRETTSKRETRSKSKRDTKSKPIPKSIQTAVFGSPAGIRSRSAEPSMQKSRSVDMGTSSQKKRSQSVDPEKSMRKSRSADMGMSSRKSRSADSEKSIRKSRSVDMGTTSQPAQIRSADPLTDIIQETRSYSPSRRNRSRSEDTSKSTSASHKTDSSGKRRSEAVPYQLASDMAYIADGMNLDKNTRALLAAFDAKTLEDFYLMTDVDFKALIQRAKSTNHSLPPLQMRKVQMLRSWLKEVVDDNVTEAEESRSGVRRKRKVQLIPKDWKEQYKNDLPHLKLQLRQQGDSLIEKIKNLSEILSTPFSCGSTMMY